MAIRISIITPSFEQVQYLEECLRSVHDQAYPAVEHIVVDGGSTDGSRQVIERHAHELAWWCSEADRGQSHALNKGLAHATGEVFGWINSDDLLLPGSLERVGAAFAEDPNLVVLTCVRRLRHPDGREEPMAMDDADDPERLFTAPRINQQCTFFRMDAVRAVEGLEERLHCVMDYELWLQVLLRYGTAGVRVVPWELAVFRAHAASKTARMRAAFLDEQASVLHRMCLTVGLDAYARVLALGHVITPNLRPLPVDSAQQERVRDMVVAFLLKWHHTIFSRSDHRMMRALREERLDLGTLTAEQQEQLGRLDQQLRARSWLAFRLRRKLHHLFG